MTPLHWLVTRPVLYRVTLALALMTWGAVIIMAGREPRPPGDANGRCTMDLVGPLG